MNLEDARNTSNESVEGKPLRISDLNVEALAQYLHDNKVRTSQGKVVQPLHEAHKEIILDPARYKVLAAGRRLGKSLLAALMGISVLMQLNRKVWIVAPTYDAAEKVFREIYGILVTQLQIVGSGGKGKGQARNQKGEYFIKTPWGSVLEAKSMDRPDSLAGDAVDFVIIDEAALQPNLEDVWNQMLQPVLLDKEGSAIFISTPRGKNDFYKLYLLGKLGLRQKNGEAKIEINEETGESNDVTDWSAFQKTSYDNPLLASSPEKSKEEINAAYRRAVLSNKVVKFKQEYMADFEAVSDTVFPGFIEESSKKHPYPNVVDYNWHPSEGAIYSSSDHNYAKPAATLFAQVNRFNDVIIFDERFTPNTTSFMQAQQIMDKQKDLNELAKKIWKEESFPMQYWYPIEFQDVIADVSGDQVQLSGRSAWDDFQTILGRRPVGLKQPREVGCNMVRHWLQFPQLDKKGRPLLDEDGEQKTLPKLFINSSCVNLIYALSSAKFKEGKKGILKDDYEETPGGYEGLIDALRYLMVYLFHDTNQHFSLVGGF